MGEHLDLWPGPDPEPASAGPVQGSSISEKLVQFKSWFGSILTATVIIDKVTFSTALTSCTICTKSYTGPMGARTRKSDLERPQPVRSKVHHFLSNRSGLRVVPVGSVQTLTPNNKHLSHRGERGLDQ